MALLLVAAVARYAHHFVVAGSRHAPAAVATAAGERAAGTYGVAAAFSAHLSDVPVEDGGTVEALLREDREGSRHQRFLVRVAGGPVVLMSHNVDIAAHVADLKVGDVVRFRGEYEWNDRGGVVHWTHTDPAGRHEAGWIEHDGRRYQ